MKLTNKEKQLVKEYAKKLANRQKINEDNHPSEFIKMHDELVVSIRKVLNKWEKNQMGPIFIRKVDSNIKHVIERSVNNIINYIDGKSYMM